MSRRWSDATAFRAEKVTAPAARPSTSQSVALLAVLTLVAGALLAASYLVKPDRARAFDLLHGSVFLADQRAPVAVDLASGKPTLRLLGVAKQLGVRDPGQLVVVPATNATVLLNTATGEFTMAGATGFVVKNGVGVQLAKSATATTSAVYPTLDASDSGQSYIVRTTSARTGPARTDVFLVDESVVASATTGSPPSPQASVRLPFRSANGAGAAVSANGELWLLSDTGTGGRVHELGLPAHRVHGGVALVDRPQDEFTGPTALATAAAPAARAGSSVSNAFTGAGSAVALASADRIKIFRPDGSTSSIPFSAGTTPAEEILPMTSAAGSFAFLLRTAAGWSVVSVSADGSSLRGPVPLAGLPLRAELAAPAYSGGAAFTVDRRNGRIYRIALGGEVSEVFDYPSGADAVTFTDAYVVARGPRVFVDSTTHASEVAIFTDGRLRAHAFLKSSAVDVSATQGPNALTQKNVKVASKSPSAKTPPKSTIAPIDNTASCSKSTQQPHQPTLETPLPGSRTAKISWTYPQLDPQDCVPSTYVVQVTALSGDVSREPQNTIVNNDMRTTVQPLFPATTYQVSVYAKIGNLDGPTSPATMFTTDPEGPAAPTNLVVVADSAGNWNLSWSGCGGGPASGCVYVDDWTIDPTPCGNVTGIVVAPARNSNHVNNITQEQPPFVYRGSDALLGRGLQFTVTGQGTAGEGSPSTPSPCVYSRSPAVAGALALTASTPANTPFGQAVAAKVNLDLGAHPVHDVGGVSASITFLLTGGGTTQRQSATFDGRQSNITATFSGLRAGTAYQVSATVVPAHGGSPVAVQATVHATRSDWPAVTLGARCPATGQITCQLQVTIGGVSRAAADGEYFDFTGTLTCGSISTGITATHFDPAVTAGTPITEDLSQLDGFHGTCTVTGSLQESVGDQHLFGGLATALKPVALDLATATGGAGAADFSVAFDDRNGAVAVITYTGSNLLLGSLTKDWTETIVADDGTSDCSNPAGSSAPGRDATSAVVVPISIDCVRRFGDQPRTWTAHIGYADLLTGQPQSATVTFTGTPVGYLPCAPLTDATGFTAAWDTPDTDGVTVSYAGSNPPIGGCSNFAYQLIAPDGTACGLPATGVDPSTPVNLTCSTLLPAAGWTVHITWHNDDTGQDDSRSPDLTVPQPPP